MSLTIIGQCLAGGLACWFLTLCIAPCIIFDAWAAATETSGDTVTVMPVRTAYEHAFRGVLAVFALGRGRGRGVARVDPGRLGAKAKDKWRRKPENVKRMCVGPARLWELRRAAAEERVELGKAKVVALVAQCLWRGRQARQRLSAWWHGASAQGERG